jgi:putative membrane protein
MRLATLWFAFFGGAVAWTARLLVSYPLVPLACDTGSTLPLHLVTAGSATLAVTAGLVGWRLCRRLGGGGEDAPAPRQAFMARTGVLLSGIFLLSIVLEGASPVLQGDPCLIPKVDPPRALRVLPWLAGLPAPAPAWALAHAVDEGGPASAWSGAEAGTAALLLLAAGLYARGWCRLSPRDRRRRLVTGRRAAAVGAGLGTLAVALLSPLDAASAALFSAHMVQHLLLVTVAAPLLVLGAPLVPALWGLPRGARHALGRAWRARAEPAAAWRGLTYPPVAALVHAVGIGTWHVPALYEAALRSQVLHVLEHVTFLTTALLFWWSVLRAGAPSRGGHGLALLSVFALTLGMSALGALLTFSPRPWYPAQALGAAAWGLTPLEDQQLAGLIMWAPGGVVYALTAGALFVAWLREAERRVRQRETGGSPTGRPPGAAARPGWTPSR